MTYEQFVYDVFLADQNDIGVELDDIQDVIQRSPFSLIEKFLIKCGYNLQDEFNLVQY